MSDTPRRPWEEGPDEEATEVSWLSLDDDELLLRIETLDPQEEADESLLEVVHSDRHFFIRQEAAKRVRDRSRLFDFEDDRHVGQILVRHLTRREDVTYLERLAVRGRHVEVRSAAQVQLARLWRRLEVAEASRAAAEAPVGPPAGGSGGPTGPPAAAAAGPTGPPAAAAVVTTGPPVAGSAEPEGVASMDTGPHDTPADGVDGSLLGWAIHFVVEQAWPRLGTTATRGLLRRTHQELLARHAILRRFSVDENAHVHTDLSTGPRLPREAVAGVAGWIAAFRHTARKVGEGVEGPPVRKSTKLMADALEEVGFYRALDEAEAARKKK
jgi:hypothetical protein